MEEISKGTLTEDMLRAVAGTRRLETVTHLELVIDSAETPSVEGVWPSVPSLHTLVLNGSRLMSFRDLGVGLRNLHTLSLEDSGVDDLDGIGVLSGLKELRLANNNVSDVTPLACHGHLQVLDLEQNRIGDVKELEIMGTISLLYRYVGRLCGVVQGSNQLKLCRQRAHQPHHGRSGYLVRALYGCRVGYRPCTKIRESSTLSLPLSIFLVAHSTDLQQHFRLLGLRFFLYRA